MADFEKRPETPLETPKPEEAKAKKKQKQKQVTGKESVGKSKLVIGLILIIAAVMIAVFLVPYFANKQTTYQGLVALKDIAAGEQVTQDNYSTMFTVITTTDANIAKKFVNPSATPNFYGKYAQRAIKKDAYIEENDFAYTYSVVKLVFPENKELVGVSVPSIEADVGYLPKTGDIIRFYGLEADPDSVVVDEQGKVQKGLGKKAFIYELLQYVQIYRAVDADGLTAGNGRQPVSIVLVCSTAQVKQLIEAQNNGLLYFSLISTDNPTRAEECLKLQEQIEEDYLIRNKDLENLGYKDVSIDLSKFSVNAEEIEAGDYVSLSVAREIDSTYIDAKGEEKTKKITELFTPDILSCIKVNDIYDAKGISNRLSYVGKQPLDIKKATIGLELTEEQIEALSEYMKNGSVILQKIETDTESTEDPYQAKMAVVAEAIRKARIENNQLAQETVTEETDPVTEEPTT